MELLNTLSKSEKLSLLNVSTDTPLGEKPNFAELDDIKDLRAAVLALAVSEESKSDAELLTFVKLRDINKEDIYLKCALYLMNGEVGPLLRHTYTGTEEILLALSVIPDLAAGIVALRKQFNLLLGRLRTIRIAENIDLFMWLIGALREIPTSLGRQDVLCKAFVSMYNTYIKPETSKHNLLLQNGYSELEIAYLNIKALMVNDAKVDSITACKAATEMCRIALNSPADLGEAFLKDLSNILLRYRRFKTRIKSSEGILDELNLSVKLTSPTTCISLYSNAGLNERHLYDWLALDPLSDDYKQVHENLTSEKQRILFCAWLYNNADRDAEFIKERTEQYNSIVQFILNEYNYAYCDAVGVLVDKGIVKPNEMTEERYIESYVSGLKTRKAFEFYRSLGGRTECSDKAFGFMYMYNTRVHLDYLKREFLSDEEQLEMVSLFEEHVFTKHANAYFIFVRDVLKSDITMNLIPFEDRLKVFQTLGDRDDYTLNSIYLSEEEKKIMAQEAEERQKEADEETFYNHYDGSLYSLLNLTPYFRRKYLKDKVREALLNISPKLDYDDIISLLNITPNLIRNNVFTLQELKDFINMIEEEDADDTNDVQ
jgi:hypothetical protein